ncbi:MAG: hypothetical protein ACKOGD_10415, partial [Sphingomonadales bacterium]
YFLTGKSRVFIVQKNDLEQTNFFMAAAHVNARGVSAGIDLYFDLLQTKVGNTANSRRPIKILSSGNIKQM